MVIVSKVPQIASLVTTNFHLILQITEMLSGASSQVLIITSVPLFQFRSPVVLLGDSDGFLRSLATDNPPPPELQLKCPSLEVPNLVMGLPAAG